MSFISRSELIRRYTVEKKSSFEISNLYKCSEHKINYWLKKYKIPKRSISEAIYQKCNSTGDPFRIKTISSIKDAQLLGLGLGLYWGEGNKKNKNSIRLGNTNPTLIRKFIEFLVEILGAKKEKLRFGLQIFTDIPKSRSVNFWLQELKKFGINRNQFFKVTVTPSRSIGNYREKSQYGVLTVHFSNTKLKNILDKMLPT